MIKFVITSPDVREMKGVGKTSGQPYHMRLQTVYMYPVDEHGVIAELPDKFDLPLDKDQPAYARGQYTMSPSSLSLDFNGRLQVRPRFVPIVSQAKAG